LLVIRLGLGTGNCAWASGRRHGKTIGNHAGKPTINLNPDLFISNLIQYDNASDSLGVNSRLQWEYKPGAKFFFVVNQGYEVEGSRFSPQGYGTALKLGTLFRF